MDLPARIGKYELQELLGGGMSHVYRARDTVIGRTVAVKILTEQGARDPEAKARFLREAQVAGNLDHDNVISVYDFGEEDGCPFMVMEFLRGEDLRSLIRNGKTGDLHWKLRTALQLGRAIEHIHAHKIIHRDIKPENIQVTAAGVVKLMDFGIAKAENTQLTRPGFTLGTPFYMSPEQVRGQAVTLRADIYSFGVLLFELLTGVRPIDGDTIERIFYEILYHPVDLKPLETANVPALVSELVARCTAKEPAERPRDFAEVCATLERALWRLEHGDAEPEPARPAASAGSATGARLAAAAKPAAASVATPPAMPAAAAVPDSLPEASVAGSGAGSTPAAAPRRRNEILLAAAGLVMIVAATWLYFSDRPAPSTRLSAELATPTGQMVLIPAGPFLAGQNRARVELPAFYIDRTEVTNSAWARFCKETRRRLPEGFRADLPEFPVVNVTFNESQEFAAWAGKRLPTALEWEKAARGTDGRTYPWGDKKDPALANVRDNPSRSEPSLLEAASLEGGGSPFRILNMIGNAWEFVDERRTPTQANLSA
ncbi:MAG TPA: bifunctional serine/threonine-protein kinase/formylglycine-generating enzyme family protein, partial [Bryobacteraceae bacterium]|nr:bifunctional serine/threonine-protein kinase/formylglycine-generating enzyme family protein [Bryobacteraceae bacterium]